MGRRLSLLFGAAMAAMGLSSLTAPPVQTTGAPTQQNDKQPVAAAKPVAPNEVNLPNSLVGEYRTYRKEPIWVGSLRDGRGGSRPATRRGMFRS